MVARAIRLTDQVLTRDGADLFYDLRLEELDYTLFSVHLRPTSHIPSTLICIHSISCYFMHSSSVIIPSVACQRRRQSLLESLNYTLVHIAFVLPYFSYSS